MQLLYMHFIGCSAAVQMAAEAPLLGPGGELRCSQCKHKDFQCFGCQDLDKKKRKKTKQPPTSPDKRLIQNTPAILAAMEHASQSRKEQEERTKVAERKFEEKRADDKQKRQEKQAEKKSQQEAISKAEREKQLDLEWDSEGTTSLKTCALVDVEVEVKSSGKMGRGVFAKVVLPPKKIACNYMGNRCFVTGVLAMECLHMQALLMALPEELRDLVENTPFDSTWSVNVGNIRNAFTSIDGSIAASRHLDGIPKRAGFGIASLVNSCRDIVGQRPNCRFIWLRRSATSFKMHNQYVGLGDDCADGALEVIDEIQPGQELFWSYNYHAVHGTTPVKPPRNKTERYPLPTKVKKMPVLLESSAISAAAPAVASSAYAPAVASSAAAPAVASSTAAPAVVSSTAAPAVALSANDNGEADLQSFYFSIDGRELNDDGDAPADAPTPVAVSHRAIQLQSKTEEDLYRFGDPNDKATSASLKKFISEVHKMVPDVVLKENRISNITNGHSQIALKQWCLLQAARMRYARENHVKSTLSARDNVEACMRLLSIFSQDQQARTFYLQSRQIVTAGELTAKELDVDSVFWKYIENKFHDPAFHLPFKFDYIPTAFTTVTSEKVAYKFDPPESIKFGLLSAMDLLHGRIPPHYAQAFFSRLKLHSLWKDSLSNYRKAMGGWKSSGTAMSRPLYHFVQPTTIFDPKRPLQTCGLTVVTKRWDTIAWYEPCTCPCHCYDRI
jgi:hypothetical protein